MNTPDPVQPPAPVAIPWYKSQQLQALLTLIVAQVFARVAGAVQAKYHFDVTSIGISVPEIVSFLMDGISLGAAWWGTHVRVTQKAAPKLVATQTKADVANAAAATAPPTLQAVPPPAAPGA